MREELERLKQEQAAKMKELSKLMEYEPQWAVVWKQLGEISNAISDIIAKERATEIQKLEEKFWLDNHRKPRRNHCFQCRKELLEVERQLCSKCNWMICDYDGACGCKYIKKQGIDVFGDIPF